MFFLLDERVFSEWTEYWLESGHTGAPCFSLLPSVRTCRISAPQHWLLLFQTKKIIHTVPTSKNKLLERWKICFGIIWNLCQILFDTNKCLIINIKIAEGGFTAGRAMRGVISGEWIWIKALFLYYFYFLFFSPTPFQVAMNTSDLTRNTALKKV